jgi:alpha-1,6-mannosyltransferase
MSSRIDSFVIAADFTIATLAFRSYFLAISAASPESKVKHYRICLYLLTLSGIIFRAEIAVLLAAVTSYVFLAKGASLTKIIIPAGIGGVLIGLSLTLTIDSYFWQRFPLWPEWTAFYYNTIEGHASEWGVSPWHFYFANALPKLLFNPLTYLVLLPISIVNPATTQRSVDVLLPHVVFVVLYSVLPHKEWRFIIYSVPPVTAVAAAGASWIWTRRTKSLLYGFMSLILLGSVFLSLAASLLMLIISSQNYPGGIAMTRLPEIITNDQPIVRIHLDNLACQSGATRFLEYHQNRRPRTQADSQTKTSLTTWIYDKTEDQSLLLQPEFWIDFDYALVEKPEKTIGKWEIVDQVYAFAGVKLLHPEDASSLSKREEDDSSVGMVIKLHNQLERMIRAPLLRGRWIEVRMEPKINIVKRQPI